MLSVYSEDHRLHHARAELYGGALVPAFEKPERAEHVLARVREVGLGPIVAPADFGLGPLRRVHDEGFLRFLETCWRDWTAAGKEGEAIATVWPSRGMQIREPNFMMPMRSPVATSSPGFFQHSIRRAATPTT